MMKNIRCSSDAHSNVHARDMDKGLCWQDQQPRKKVMLAPAFPGIIAGIAAIGTEGFGGNGEKLEDRTIMKRS
jgi:hypothetical protein